MVPAVRRRNRRWDVRMRIQILIDMVKEGILKIEDAAFRCGLSVEEFGEQM